MKNNLEEKNKPLHQANPNYKDSLFKKVFSEKEDLLELFNAVSGRNCKDADELTIYTLDNVIDRCIKRGILSDILTKQRGEVRSMILAYTREKHEHFMKKEGREMVNKLNIKLLEENRIEDVKRAAVDVVYQNQLLKEYDLIDENEFNEANIG